MTVSLGLSFFISKRAQPLLPPFIHASADIDHLCAGLRDAKMKRFILLAVSGNEAQGATNKLQSDNYLKGGMYKGS